MSETNAQINNLIRQAKLQLKVDDTKPDLVPDIDVSISSKQSKDNVDVKDPIVFSINFDKVVYDALFR